MGAAPSPGRAIRPVSETGPGRMIAALIARLQSAGLRGRHRPAAGIRRALDRGDVRRSDFCRICDWLRAVVDVSDGFI